MVGETPLKGPVKVRPDRTIVETLLLSNSPTGFIIEWVTRTAGFGMVTFQRWPLGILCANESLSRSFVREILEKFLEGKPEEQWPLLLRDLGGIDRLLDATTHPRAWTES